MKRALFALVALAAISSFSGCCCMDRLFCGGFWCKGGCGGCGGCNSGCGSCGGCDSCGGGCDSGCGCDGGYSGGGGGCGCEGNMPLAQKVRGVRQDMGYAQDGPPAGSTAYPYYTNRGPRDFLAKNPPSIGP